MPRYIDRDTFQKFLEDEIEETKLDKENSYGDVYYEMAVGARECAFREILSKLKREPTADVQEVKHGRWAHLGEDEWCCTCCGFVITTEGSWEKPAEKYCSNCGAKMNGGESE